MRNAAWLVAALALAVGSCKPAPKPPAPPASSATSTLPTKQLAPTEIARKILPVLDRTVAANELQNINLSVEQFCDSTQRAPKDATEVGFGEQTPIGQAIKSGLIVVNWSAASGEVLAYDHKVLTKGGMVVRRGQAPERMTAEELKQALRQR